MRVLLHEGGAGFFARSGIGQSVRQQARALEVIGAERVRSLAEQPDVVVLNFATPGSALLARRARRRGIPVVYHAHSTEEDTRGSVHLSDQLAPLYRRFLTACYAGADLLITPTAYSRRLLRGYGLEMPIEVLSNGVDTTFFTPEDHSAPASASDAAPGTSRARFRAARGIAEDATVVVGVGHWFRRKGIVDLIEVAHRLPRVQVWWFGHTHPCLVQSDVRAALAAAPANFHAPGYVGREELRDAYRAADLFALMSREETEGIVVLEALATGVPVVVSDIPVFERWLREGETNHVARSVDDLVELVGRAEAGTLEDLREAGRQVALDRDLAVIARRLPAIYARAGRGPGVRGSPRAACRSRRA